MGWASAQVQYDSCYVRGKLSVTHTWDQGQTKHRRAEANLPVSDRHSVLTYTLRLFFPLYSYIIDTCAVLQAHMSRLPPPISDYVTDTRSALDNSVRLAQVGSPSTCLTVLFCSARRCTLKPHWPHGHVRCTPLIGAGNRSIVLIMMLLSLG